MPSAEELDASEALKSIARNISLKSSLQQMPIVYSALWSAARRFDTGETRKVWIDMAEVLATQGYGVSLEYIGENTVTEQACQAAVDEFLALSQAIEAASLKCWTSGSSRSSRWQSRLVIRSPLPHMINNFCKKSSGEGSLPVLMWKWKCSTEFVQIC